VHDPAQAWNVLTVGAYTELDKITDPSLKDYSPIAGRGQLSPFTTTSHTWHRDWPLKPEIVMEGGNLAHDGKGAVDQCDDLSVLSTSHSPPIRHFAPHSMTSAATAQASWLAAQIQCAYPDVWPETVRALMVHSATWSDQLKEQFLEGESKTAYGKLLRVCGYGVPDLSRALYSASDAVTLIAQKEIQPYDRRKSGNGFRTRDMHVHHLPWPKEVLLSLPDDVDVQMRVTLSYFPEPGPGAIGWKDRYRYASFGLRFDVKAPDESKDEFVRRINKAVRTEEKGAPGTSSAADHWVIGANARNKGSIHSDIWKGTAAELASSDAITVYPVIGWWKERSYLGRWNRRSRYSLIASIATTAEDVDIYTPIAAKLKVPVSALAFAIT